MNFLARLLKTPSSFEGDPIRFFWNVVGHSWVVGGICVWLLAQLGVPGDWPLAIILVGYASWEALQWWRYEAEAWDCLDDTGFVMIAACAVHYQLWWLVLVQMLFLNAGYLRRKTSV